MLITPVREFATPLPDRDSLLGRIFLFSGVTKTKVLDATTPVLTVRSQILQFRASTRCLINIDEQWIGEVDAGVIVEVDVGRKASISVHPVLSTSLGATVARPQYRQARYMPSFPWVISALGVMSSAWVEMAEIEGLEYGQTVVVLTALVGPGNLWIQGQQPEHPTALVKLTADIALATFTPGQATLIAYTSEHTRRWPGKRRVQVELTGATPPDTVTFGDIFQLWQAAPTGQQLGDTDSALLEYWATSDKGND
jgi:hypothetical protein